MASSPPLLPFLAAFSAASGDFVPTDAEQATGPEREEIEAANRGEFRFNRPVYSSPPHTYT